MAPDVKTEARTEILRRIAAANGGRPLSREAVEEAWDRLPRRYRRSDEASEVEVLALLQHRLRDYGAYVEVCPSAEVAGAVAARLRRRGVRLIALPTGFPQVWLPSGFEFLQEERIDLSALARCQGVLTGATVAIAETGTLVLQGVPGQGRRATTLVPDYHLCVVRTADIVRTVPETLLRLDATKTLPTTFVSGPSATADIEMTRIQGVHGPRVLDVLLVG